MSRNLRWLTSALLAVALATPCYAQAKKAGGKPAAEPTCGDHGTNVKFEKNPQAAATKALKEEKLVLVIHISGYFEEPDYT